MTAEGFIIFNALLLTILPKLRRGWFVSFALIFNLTPPFELLEFGSCFHAFKRCVLNDHPPILTHTAVELIWQVSQDDSFSPWLLHFLGGVVLPFHFFTSSFLVHSFIYNFFEVLIPSGFVSLPQSACGCRF
eukprot:EG_transcript_28407